MSESGATPAAAKGASASAQIHAATQKNTEMLAALGEELAVVKAILQDHSKILQELDSKLDSARLAAPKGSRAKSSGTAPKKERNHTAPPIHIWFCSLWKDSEQETISKYCVKANVDAVIKAVDADPRHKSKKDGMRKSIIARAYYTKHFAKRESNDYEEAGHKALMADHKAMQKKLADDGESDAGDAGDADGDDGDE